VMLESAVLLAGLAGIFFLVRETVGKP